MNRLIIPPAPNWYEPNLIACTPDNTFIYASRRDVVVINPRPPDESADIKIIRKCHHERTNGVGFSPFWGKPDKLALSYGDDKVVCLLDLTTYNIKKAHNGHKTRSEKLVGAIFCGHDRIVSISEDGFIIVWKWAGDQLLALEDLLGSKVKVSCISSCPHVSWLAAIGMKRGEIVIVDLRKTGRILHRLRGHDSNIISLSWCPAPYNIFLSNVKTEEKPKQKEVPENDNNEVNKDILENVKQFLKCLSNPENGAENVTDRDKIETIIDSEDKVVFEAETEDNLRNNKEQIRKTDNENEFDIIEDQSPLIHEEKAATSYANIDQVKKEEDSEITDLPEQKEIGQKDVNKDKNDTKPVEQNQEVPNEVNNTINESDIKGEIQEKKSECHIKEEANSCLEAADTSEHNESKDGNLNKNENDINSVEQNQEEAAKEFLLASAARGGSGYNESEDGNLNKNENDIKSVEQNQEETAKEFLLASAARGGRSIIIWRAGTNGVKQTELQVFAKPKNRKYHEEKPWITLCWATPTGLLCSSHKGELIQYNLSIQKDNGHYKWRLVHSDHWKQLFGIAVPLKLYHFWEEKDWKDDDVHAWTIGKDRYIYNTSLGVKRNTVAAYPTFPGSVFCLASSVYFPNQIAIGSADGNCRLWDLSRPHTQYLVMKHSFDKIQSCKIVSVAWNPQKENILAYGCADGRVALIDPCNCYKQPSYLIQHGSNAIHRLNWGPLKEKPEYMGLYVVTSGKLLIYDAHVPLAEPIVFDKCQGVSDVAWKPDWTVCAIANKEGHVMLFSKTFELITTLYMQNKAVRWLAWHPPAAVNEESVSSNSNWLAVASTSIIVYNCALDNNEPKDLAEKVVAVFNNHVNTVECLSWSTFEKGKLASVDSSGVALIWDVDSKTLLHVCKPLYEDSFMSILWSPLDPDYIITGSRNNVLQIWKLSDHPPEQLKAKKHHYKTLKLPMLEPEESEEEQEEAEVVKQTKKPQKFVLPNLVQLHTRTDPTNLLKQCKKLYAHFFNKPEFNETCSSGIGDKQVDMVKLFGDEQSFNAVLELEKNCRHKKKLPRNSAHISLWQGNVSSVIKEAIDTKTLDSWLVSLAPTISHWLYMEACEAYADQLSEEGSQAYESASYYLVCHKFDKAVEVLCSSHNYTEALALAKCHLLSTDPLIASIIERWAKYSISIGCYEVAAQCYIMLKQPEEAAKALFKREDEETLEFAEELAAQSENADLLSAVLFRLNAFKNANAGSPEKNGGKCPENNPNAVDISESIEEINEEESNVDSSENIKLISGADEEVVTNEKITNGDTPLLDFKNTSAAKNTED